MNKLTLAALFIISILLQNHLCQAQCHRDDWEALKALYDITNGDKWINRTGWDVQIANQSSPPANCNLADLYGIQLTDNRRVTCIDMDGIPDCYSNSNNGGNHLTGPIPPEINKLSHLKLLSLFRNNLSGNLPAELFDLNNLEILGLRGNQLSGEIPPQIGDLLRLKRLYLGVNKFTGNIPVELTNLSNLIWCDLASNKLTGNIPPEIGNLSNLDALQIGFNQLTGNIPDELYDLKNLRFLWLYRNEFTGTISPKIKNLITVEEVGFYDNLITGIIPSEIGSLHNLTWLSLKNTQLTGSLPTELCNLTKLTTLEIYDNNLTGCYPDCFKVFCKQLSPEEGTNFYISDGNNFDAEWEDFCATSVGACPPAIDDKCHMDDWTALKALYENTDGDNWINRTGWDTYLANQSSPLANCDLANLYGIQLDDNGRVSFIDLNSNQLSGSIPPELGDLSNLTNLRLSQNQLSGSIPPELGDLSNLVLLEINDNLLSGCYANNLTKICDLITSPNFGGNSDISDDNYFDATWEDFCNTGEDGACPPNEHVSTNYSGYVSLNLDNNKDILKNKFANVYDHGLCSDYSDLANCVPVSGYENKSANEAFWIVTKAAEYFSTYFDIKLPVVNIVVNSTNDPNRTYFYHTSNVIELGAGDGVERNSMSAPDITAHEYLHFLQHNLDDLFSPLKNTGEPGALRESMADIFGEIIEHQCYGENDWIIASQAMSPGSSKQGIRNLSQPIDSTMSTICPDTYLEEPWIPIGTGCNLLNDWCNIHINCGVHNYWFYILANNIKMEEATDIVFNNFTRNLDSISSYYNAAARSIKTVEDLYGSFSTQKNEVIDAWHKVGISLEELNFIEWRIEVDTIVFDDKMNTIKLELVIDSVGQDISADGLDFTLHLDQTYLGLEIDDFIIYEPLDTCEVQIEIDGVNINVKIDRKPIGNSQNTKVLNQRIKSNEPILGFTLCVPVADGGEKGCIKPMQISGHTTIDSTKNINFKPDILYLGSCINSADGQEGFNLIYTALDITQKKCFTLGTAKIETIKDTEDNSKLYTYKLFSGGIQIEHINSSESSYLFNNLDEGYYTLELEDNSNGRAFVEFEVKFIAETEEVNCCPENLIIPPGNIKSSCKATNTISFEIGSLVLEGEFEICE